ncbi:dUTP diphosphatase [Bacillus sp. B15-48]|uniref:dUTP diphosphatase n=1 Tax=Bacillus sp. B15-48 TaxID=1548601 RepID=UPI00193F741F|nr:dUTP diphosphatase [Bacillus sp. B15-48]MBM4762734.1 dUTPase [Bacillus sp. B15-48]
MDLEKMLQMQKELDDRIIKEKGLEGQDLFPNTVLALQVELAEFANEARFFKHWSDRREPKYGREALIDCPKCQGRGFWFSGNRVLCGKCNETGKVTNPLLEEYVDSVHFFLSIANQKGWQDALFISSEPFFECAEEMQKEGKGKYLSDTYLEMIYFLMKSYMEVNPENKKIAGFQINVYHFRLAWSLFMTIGIVGFDFTPAQIEDAYFTKNAVNHQRQESGY